MIQDPYTVLGVSRSASNDEIKKAYRELSRKFHPDSYANNPLSELAEEKFKEVQDAYKQIMSEREGGSNGSYQSNGYDSSNYNTGNYNSGYSNDDDVRMNAALNYINARHFREALNVLSGIHNRNGRWYYLSAIANSGIGNNYEAMNHAQTACNMEPGNPEYSRLLNQLQWSGQRYQAAGYGQRNNTNDAMDCCCNLWIADTLCECMGGDLCACM